MPTIGIAAAIRQPPRQRRKHQIGATSPNSARPNTVAMNALNQTLSACVIGCCGPPVAATTLSFSVATHAGAGGAAPAVVLPATDTRWTSRSEEHTSELPSLMRNSYAVFCLKKKTKETTN